VLNARRHRSGRTRKTGRAGIPLTLVLNARRHRSGRTKRGIFRLWRYYCCAQRPKASERKNAGTAVLSFMTDGCSTPEGIGAEERSRRRGASPSDTRVLNARRHRSGRTHRAGDARRGWGSCAQRPKASERKNARMGRTKPMSHRCAQRPKASERKNAATLVLEPFGKLVLNARRHRSGRTLATLFESLEPSFVLNARRHRSGRTERGRYYRPRRRVVLNARRHRSGRTRPALGRRLATPECSTPEGIGAEERTTAREPPVLPVFLVLNARRHRSGRTTPPPRRPSGEALVLNARRHRSGRTKDAGVCALRAEGCSTPEGIGAEERTSWNAVTTSPACAQRPKASERKNAEG